MRKIITMLLVLAGSFLGVEAPASAAPLPGYVQFNRIYFDTPGTDLPITNYKLNQEWVEIVNGTSRTLNTLNWRLRDYAGHTFVFPSRSIPPQTKVYVHTGKGTNWPAVKDGVLHLYWQSGYYIWNNTWDVANLYSNTGARLDSCSWPSTLAGNVRYC